MYTVFMSGRHSSSAVVLNLRVKVIVEALPPSLEGATATAATLMLYWVPGFRFVMTKDVLVVLFSSPAQRTVNHVALPSGCAQFREMDEVVTEVTLRFPTTAGSANVRDNRGAQEDTTEAGMGTWQLAKV